MSKELICHAPREPYFTVSNIYIAREETDEDGTPLFIIKDNKGDEYAFAAVDGCGESSYGFNFYLLED